MNVECIRVALLNKSYVKTFEQLIRRKQRICDNTHALLNKALVGIETVKQGVFPP